MPRNDNHGYLWSISRQILSQMNSTYVIYTIALVYSRTSQNWSIIDPYTSIQPQLQGIWSPTDCNCKGRVSVRLKWVKNSQVLSCAARATCFAKHSVYVSTSPWLSLSPWTIDGFRYHEKTKMWYIIPPRFVRLQKHLLPAGLWSS